MVNVSNVKNLNNVVSKTVFLLKLETKNTEYKISGLS